MASVVDRIIEIEKANCLYELKDSKDMPVWDILRYDVIKAIEYRYNPNREMLPKASLRHRLIIFLKSLMAVLAIMTLGKKRVFFFSHSRNRKPNGQLFDRIANDLIMQVKPKDCVVFDANLGEKTCYNSYDLPVGLFYAIYRKSNLDAQIGKVITDALNDGFKEEVISFQKLQSIYRQFIAQVQMFDWILSRTKPKKIFISYGRFKPLCFSAKKAGIPTWLMQHSLIEKDDATIAGTCPRKELGINADTLLTFGTYWGDYLKHLMKVEVLGNRIMSKVGVVPEYDGSIVVASSLYQGPYLSSFFVSFANKHEDLKFIYKLHPGEKSYLSHYRELFQACPNVKVILNEQSMDDLIQRCSLMVLVSSTTFYEALNMQKCVAVFAIPEFESLTRFLIGVPNAYPFVSEEELEQIITCVRFDSSKSITFFEPFNESFSAELVN